MEAIHFDMWLCAGRTGQIPDAGDYFIRRVGNASVIITRDEQGKSALSIMSAAIAARCSASMMKANSTGASSANTMRWTYKLDGTLANAPHMEKVEGFREADYPLNSVATADLGRPHLHQSFGAANSLL